jgi:hypothetical protein
MILLHEDKQKIRELYQSGLLNKDIAKLGYNDRQISKAIKDIRRSRHQTLLISYAKNNRKNVLNSFTLKNRCDKCNKFFNKGNFDRHTCISDKIIDEIYSLYKSGLSHRDIKKLGYNNQSMLNL